MAQLAGRATSHPPGRGGRICSRHFGSWSLLAPIGIIARMETAQPISDLSELVGKRVLVGITCVDHKDELVSQEQFHGRVESLDDGLIHIRVAGTGEDFTLPPDPSAFTRARPGSYRLRSTGEVVVDPDFTSSWTVRAPGAGEQSEDLEEAP